MATYRVYMLDGRGRITWGEWFEAADQEAAKTHAKSRCLPGTPSVELWQGAERIWRFNCPEQEVSGRG